MITWWIAAQAFAGEVGVPLEPLSSLPWEVAAPAICGATTHYDGSIVMHRWWVRDESGRLVKIVHQQVGRESFDEERFAYDASGRLVAVERWEWRPPADPPVPGYPTGWVEGGVELQYLHDDAGELVRVRRDYADPRLNDEEWPYVPSDRASQAVWAADRRSATEQLGAQELTWTFDAKGAPLTVLGETNGRPEIETWHRDCAAFPPLPTPKAAAPAGAPEAQQDDAQEFADEGMIGGAPETAVRSFHHREIEVRKKVDPDYPAEAEAMNLGPVDCRVRVYIDERGVPYDVLIDSCPRMFHDSARETLLKWRFRAPEVAGQAVKGRFLMNLRFVPD